MLAEANGLFTRKLTQNSDQGRRTAFAQRVLTASANRVVGEWRIELRGVGKGRQARLASTATA